MIFYDELQLVTSSRPGEFLTGTWTVPHRNSSPHGLTKHLKPPITFRIPDPGLFQIIHSNSNQTRILMELLKDETLKLLLFIQIILFHSMIIWFIPFYNLFHRLVPFRGLFLTGRDGINFYSFHGIFGRACILNLFPFLPLGVFPVEMADCLPHPVVEMFPRDHPIEWT